MKYLYIILILMVSVLKSQTPTISENDAANFGLTRTSIPEWKQTGCLKRLNNIKVTKYINLVTDMGAIGDGNFDNTSILKNAIASAKIHNSGSDINNGFTVIFLPSGTYKLTNKVNIESNMLLQGESTYNTTLLFDFREKADNGQELNIDYLSIYKKQNAGIENVYISRVKGNDYNDSNGLLTETSYSLSSVYVINIHGSQDCWLKGIKSFKATSKHVQLSTCNNIEIRGCAFLDCTRSGPNGNGYGVVISGISHHNLIEDNVFYHLRHSMILVDNSYFNVLGYNASFDPYTSQGLFGSNNWCGDVTFHGYHSDIVSNGPWSNLVEGNRLGTVHFDYTDLGGGAHGNGDLNNIFRNSATETGLRISQAWENVSGDANINENQNVMNNYFYCEDMIDLGPWAVDNDSPNLWALNNITIEGIKKSENQEIYNWISLYNEEKPEFLNVHLPPP
ncbi:MAG: glycoside hydrolase family 55 protein, partial [Candidatus Delongbacteria bacterium]|nr:glycoside hydrolase family 55 protein [Candidatus Delongbacteria bacterium]